MLEICQPKDSMDLWKYFGNEDPAALPEMTTAEFLKVVSSTEYAVKEKEEYEYGRIGQHYDRSRARCY